MLFFSQLPFGVQNITLGTSRSVGANFTSCASGSVGAIQAIFAMYLGTPRDNLRMLEIRLNIGTFILDLPFLETGLYDSITAGMWRRHYKQQEDRIQTLTYDINVLLKETIDKSIIIADQKAEFERLCALVKEPTATNDVLQEVVTIAKIEDTKMEVHIIALDYIVENVTYGLVETKTMPLG